MTNDKKSAVLQSHPNTRSRCHPRDLPTSQRAVLECHPNRPTFNFLSYEAATWNPIRKYGDSGISCEEYNGVGLIPSCTGTPTLCPYLQESQSPSNCRRDYGCFWRSRRSLRIWNNHSRLDHTTDHSSDQGSLRSPSSTTRPTTNVVNTIKAIQRTADEWYV